MSDTISWVLVVHIQPGQDEAFKAQAAKLIESARQEPGTLGYEWSLSDNGSVCHIYERYVDSAAVLEHVKRNGEAVGALFTLARPGAFTVYGSPSEEVRTDLAGLNPVYMEALGGFSR